MCDKECSLRFQRLEIRINQIATDIQWLKRLIGGLLVFIAALFGIDITGVV